MNSIILYAAMSLDGYLADEKGGVGWLRGDGSDPAHPGTYPSFLESVDTIVMGHTTYAQIVNELSPNEWPYPGKTCHVLTHRNLPTDPRVAFSRDLKTLFAILQVRPRHTVWVCGGASVIAQCLQEHCIDELRIAVVPTLLGRGIPLFQPGIPAQTWKLVDTVSYNGIVELNYRKATSI